MKRQLLPAELPENVLAMTVSNRSWNGILMETTEFRCAGRVLHPFPRQGSTTLSVVLEEVGGRCEPRLAEHRPCPIPHMPRHMVFAPEGVPLWGYAENIRYVRDANLYFDIPALEEYLGERVSQRLASAPRLRFFDERIWTLTRLLADACEDDTPATQLYGDALSSAIVALLLHQPAPTRGSKGLAPWQLQRAVDFMEAHLPQPVALAQLATLTGLSQSYFSRAFKVSTGMAPYQWQLDCRVRRAQLLMLETKASLEAIAGATGFTDAAHLNRIFRQFTGTTPAAWRKGHRV